MIASGERVDVKLTEPVPVYWVYITAWATPDGLVQFRNDIYQRDGLGSIAAANMSDAAPQPLPPAPSPMPAPAPAPMTGGGGQQPLPPMQNNPGRAGLRPILSAPLRWPGWASEPRPPI